MLYFSFKEIIFSTSTQTLGSPSYIINVTEGESYQSLEISGRIVDIGNGGSKDIPYSGRHTHVDTNYYTGHDYITEQYLYYF